MSVIVPKFDTKLNLCMIIDVQSLNIDKNIAKKAM